MGDGSTSNMDAGIEMDERVAREVMGWRVKVEQHPAYLTPRLSMAVWHKATPPRPGPPENRYDARWEHTDWSPSTDIRAAWDVVEHFGPAYIKLEHAYNDERVDGWWCDIIGPGQEGKAFADSAPLAICRAALTAVASEVRHG